MKSKSKTLSNCGIPTTGGVTAAAVGNSSLPSACLGLASVWVFFFTTQLTILQL